MDGPRSIDHDTDRSRADRLQRFAELHRGDLFLIGNVWDAGSARLVETIGFPALATTSSGTALHHGTLDYDVDVETVIADAAAIVEATELPVSVDFEDGFGVDEAAVATHAGALRAVGVAGFSVEDYTRDRDAPIHDLDVAVARLTAAIDEAHRGPAPLVVTARTELLTNRAAGVVGDDPIGQVITRLQRFQEAGADVLFAPGLRSIDDIAAVVAAVDRPVSVMALPGMAPVEALAEVGVARVSVAGWLARAAMEGLRAAALEVIEEGTFGFMDDLGEVGDLIASSFGSRPSR